MKNIFALFLLLALFISGCKQDFDITADYKEVTVVYGLLNSNEATHYLRIQKGYLIDGDAYQAGGVADSIYYKDSLLVQIKALPNGATYTLSKVDGNLIGLPKDTGSFANQPNWLYRFTGSLNSSSTYQLTITNISNGNVITAETKLISPFTLSVPSPDPGNKGQKFKFSASSPGKAVFYTIENAGLYDLKIRFPYKEYNATDNSLIKSDYIEAYIFKSKYIPHVTGGLQVIEDVNAGIILNTLKNSLAQSTNIYREFDVSKGMTFSFAAGGTELANYINSTTAQSGSIGANEALPPYTNLSNGYGIFSSRIYQSVDSVLLTNEGLDELACHPLAAGLRFKGSSGQICE